MQLPTGAPGYRWVVLGVAWSACLVLYLTRLCIGPLAPFLKEAFALSNAQIGSLVSASVLTYAPTMILSGWLVDRIGVRQMLVAGTLIIAACEIAVFIAPSYGVMITALTLSGLGTGCIFPAAVKAVVLWFSKKERATALGLNQTAVNVSGIVGATALPTVAILLGWRYAFLFVGLTALAICLACGLLYRRPPAQISLAAGEGTSNDGHAAPVKHSTSRLLKSRDIWVLSVAGLLLCIVEYSALTHIVLYLKESLSYTAIAAGALLAMTEAAGAFGKPASGFTSDRLLGGRRKPVFIGMAGASTLVCLVLAAISDNPGWLLYPVLALLGLVAIGWGGLYATLAGELGGRELAGVAAGVSASVVVAGAVIGPPLFGYIVDIAHSYQPAWLAMAFFGALSVATATLIREHKKRI